MGTGCCFNRQALYGYNPILTEEDFEPNIFVKSCCGSRGGNEKKRVAECTIPLFNVEDTEESVEGCHYEILFP